MAKKNWIADAVEKKGALHKALKVAPSKKIPAAKMAKAAKAKNPLMKKRVSLAKTLKGFKKK